ncbi:ROK family transcriptional regulator [Aureimonas frigidaquae]|uniref:Putative transcriptional regulator, ROK family protein n=1 Tax=Aureimonas frigidaquae TaxID=424757 RepID=A0A0P0Z165_9HYPH|nr:ROK family transcriptional regulator [Aureimonas frigidaquae]BAT27646.1 putative transcriptional regulator, ROK family protein [Aureimonas frigidaquae]
MQTQDGRVAPAAAPAMGESPRVSSQAGLRAHNERLVLSLIRAHGELAKAEIARYSGLSPQTASVIMRQLEGEGLVLPGVPRRGKVGQPSVPMRLNARGAFALGLKIGRRTSEMVLMDFVGNVLGSRDVFYRLPVYDAVMAFAGDAADALRAQLAPQERSRIAGLGVGLPFEIWSWGAARGADKRENATWRNADIATDLAEVTGEDVTMANDVTAACGAERAFGQRAGPDFLYLFVGAFIGGGIVIDGQLIEGRSGNAGALGSMPVPAPGGGSRQLIEASSIHLLERLVEEAGGDPVELWRRESDWDGLGPLLDRWLDEASAGIAHAIVSAVSVYDFPVAVIDGSFPPRVRARLVERVDAALRRLDRRGLADIAVMEGTIGRSAREIGSASLPFFARFFSDRRILYADR